MKANHAEILTLRRDIEKVFAAVSPEEFGELKLNHWEDFDYEVSETLATMREEVITLISSATAYMSEDQTQSQAEVVKVIKDAKQLRASVEQATKVLEAKRKTPMSLGELIDSHYEMQREELEIEFVYKNLRQTALRALSQFSDDYSLQKVRNLVDKLAKFSFVNFPRNLLHDFKKDSFKQELTSAQLLKLTQLEALAQTTSTAKGKPHSRNGSAFESPQVVKQNTLQPSVASTSSFKLTPRGADETSSQDGRSSAGGSLPEEHKFDMSAVSSASGGSRVSHLTSNVSVGLSGLAGKPNITMNDSEAWITDPRTPIRKFASLLFKLANIRKLIFKQLAKEFCDVQSIGSMGTPDSTPSDDGNLLEMSTSFDSFVTGGNDQWYVDFISGTMRRLETDEKTKSVKLGPLSISCTARSGYTYFVASESVQSGSGQEVLLLPRFVTKYLLSNSSSVKDMLKELRRESLLLIVKYQFGFKQLVTIS